MTINSKEEYNQAVDELDLLLDNFVENDTYDNRIDELSDAINAYDDFHFTTRYNTGAQHP